MDFLFLHNILENIYCEENKYLNTLLFCKFFEIMDKSRNHNV